MHGGPAQHHTLRIVEPAHQVGGGGGDLRYRWDTDRVKVQICVRHVPRTTTRYAYQSLHTRRRVCKGACISLCVQDGLRMCWGVSFSSSKCARDFARGTLHPFSLLATVTSWGPLLTADADCGHYCRSRIFTSEHITLALPLLSFTQGRRRAAVTRHRQVHATGAKRSASAPLCGPSWRQGIFQR